MEEAVKQRLQSKDLWIRALYMVFFAIVSVIVRAVISLLAFVQFIVILVTGHANEPLLQLGNNLSTYVRQLVKFVTFNTEEQPFPFSPWPDEAVDDNPWIDYVPSARAEPEAERESPASETSSDDEPDEGDDSAR
jgi:hypothetical protein